MRVRLVGALVAMALAAVPALAASPDFAGMQVQPYDPLAGCSFARRILSFLLTGCFAVE